MLRMVRKLAPLLVLGILSAAAPSASADVPPPDSCTTVGQSCNNAGPSYDRPGTCVSTTCNRATPDGSVEYQCSRCLVGGGTGGGSGSGGGAATGGVGSDAGNGSGASSDGGCGCAFAHEHPTMPALLAALGLAVLVIRRRPG